MQGTNTTAQETDEQSSQEEGQRVLAIEHQAQEQPDQEEETAMIEQQAQEPITVDEHQAKEEEQQAHFSIHSSDSNANNEDPKGPSSSGLHIVQYREQRVNTEVEQDFVHAGSQPVNFSSTPTNFDVVSEIQSVKRADTSLESMITLMRDDQTYMKYNSQIFKRAFYKNMDEVVPALILLRRRCKPILFVNLKKSNNNLLVI
ncbi:hypothetical protein F511_16424 [Dorcoceras hygrometricum]|uniref:Uncharacterized protein n=1 Tax=Dorcoceras hygrometricum TaxID=472368 RepID=A0A2Z7AFD3_9LAMI|nr:hypothetical protein F511_16424 [Dorcoceras hygrometricum]